MGGGGFKLKKSSAGVILTDSSRDLNVWFGDTSVPSDSENSRNILFTYFSPDISLCTGQISESHL